MAPLETASNDLKSPILLALSQQTNLPIGKLLDVAKVLFLTAAVKLIGKDSSYHQGLEGGLIDDIKALQSSSSTSSEIIAWAEQNVHRLKDSFALQFSNERGQNIRLSVDNGDISDDLSEELFKSIAKQFNAVSNYIDVKTLDLSQWLASDSTSTVDAGKYSTIAISRVKDNLLTLAYVEGGWQLITGQDMGGAGWKKYQNGSRYAIPGDTEREQLLVLNQCLKDAFNLNDSELGNISFHVFRRASNAYTESLKEQLRRPYLNQYDIEVPGEHHVEQMYADLLTYPHRQRMALLLQNSNLFEINKTVLNKVLPETIHLDPQENFDDIRSGKRDSLRKFYNSLFLEPDDDARVDILLKGNHLPMDDSIIDDFSPERKSALLAISSKALVHQLHREARPIQDSIHASVYKQMATLPLDRCISLLIEKGINTLNEEMLKIALPDNEERIDSIRTKIQSAFSFVTPASSSTDAADALYRRITTPDKNIAKQYFLDIEAWEINKRVLTRFPISQQRLIQSYFGEVQQDKDKKATDIYKGLCALPDKDARVAFVKENGVTQISIGILEHFSEEDQRKILDAFIPLAQDHHANEYLYRLILMLPPNEQEARLLYDRNAWRIDEEALMSLSSPQRDIIQSLFDKTQANRDSRDRIDYEMISKIEPVQARAQVLTEKGISRLNQRVVNDFPPEDQLKLATAFTYRLQHLIADTTPNDLVKASKQELIDAKLEQLKFSIPESDILQEGELELLRPISSGNQATVYEAIHSITGQILAVKIFHTSDDEEEQEEIDEDFQNEVSALSRLPKHPNVMRYYGLKTFNIDGQPRQGIVVQYLKGVDLDIVFSQMYRLHLAGKILDHEFYAGIRKALDDVVDGLDAHGSKRIVHKDIKGFNIKCTEDGTVVLMDEGRAEQMDVEPRVFWTNNPAHIAGRFYPEDAIGIIKLFSLLEVGSRAWVKRQGIFARLTPEYEATFKSTMDEIADSETPDEMFNTVLKSAAPLVPHLPPGAFSSLLKSLAAVPPFSVEDFSPNAITDNLLFPIFRQAATEPATWGHEFSRSQGDHDLGRRILQYAVVSAQEEKKAMEISDGVDLLPSAPDLTVTSKSQDEASISDEERDKIEKLLGRTQDIIKNVDAKKWEQEGGKAMLSSIEALHALPGRSPFFRTIQLYKLDRLSKEPNRKSDLIELQRVSAMEEKAYNNIAARLMKEFDNEFNQHVRMGSPYKLMQELNGAPNTKAVINARRALFREFPATIRSSRYREEWALIQRSTSDTLRKEVIEQLNVLGKLIERQKACENTHPNPDQNTKLKQLLSTAKRNIMTRLKQLDRGPSADQLAEIRESVTRWPNRYKFMREAVNKLEQDAHRKLASETHRITIPDPFPLSDIYSPSTPLVAGPAKSKVITTTKTSSDIDVSPAPKDPDLNDKNTLGSPVITKAPVVPQTQQRLPESPISKIQPEISALPSSPVPPPIQPTSKAPLPSANLAYSGTVPDAVNVALANQCVANMASMPRTGVRKGVPITVIFVSLNDTAINLTTNGASLIVVPRRNLNELVKKLAKNGKALSDLVAGEVLSFRPLSHNIVKATTEKVAGRWKR